MEGGLSWGGDETPPLLVLWGDWLVLLRSSSLKVLPEFCLKKPGLEVCRQEHHLIHFDNHLNKKCCHSEVLRLACAAGTLVVSAPGEEGKDCWEH